MVVAQLQQHVIAKNSKTSLETSSADGKTLVPVSEIGRITCDMEFRFMLHRHWSLYEVCLSFKMRGEIEVSLSSVYQEVQFLSRLVEELQIIFFPVPCIRLSVPRITQKSMYFSNFVASKLNVWNSNGRHRLEEFLAKMGFSLEQCKQKYPFMSCQLRRRLRDQIEKYAEEYGLQDIFYGEFQCQLHAQIIFCRENHFHVEPAI